MSGAKIVSGGASFLMDYFTEDNVISSNMFYNCQKLEKLRLPNSATTIGNGSIYGLERLTELDLGTGIQKIGERGISYNSSLKQLVIPNNVTTLDSYAFAYNYGLEKVQLGNRIESLPDYCFYNCRALQEVTLPSQLKSIGGWAFDACVGLKEIKLPTTVTTIGEYAFRSCENLTEINLHEGITEIGYGVFTSCQQLSKVHLPNSLTVISEAAFSDCQALTDINLSETLTAIGRDAFHNTGLEKVKLPSKVERLEDYTFASCQKLREIDLGKTVNYIGEQALSNTGLANIEIPAQVETIRYAAFSNNYRLETVSIADGVKDIGHSAFENCPSIKSIVLPSSVTQLGSTAFAGCTGLESAEINCAITALPDGLFYHCSSLQTITLPQNLQAIGSYVFSNCTALTAFTIPSTVTELESRAFEYCSNLTEITIPKGVTNLGDYMFRGCTNLQTVNLPEGLTSIGEYTFEDCLALKDIKIPASVEAIHGAAFYYCQALESINWPEKATTIQWGTFGFCTSLKSISLPETITSIEGSAFSNSGLQSFIVPKQVTSIGSSVFFNCVNLEYITLPDGLQIIDINCFQSCQSLKSITIPASVTSIGYWAFGDCPMLTEIHAHPQETPQADDAFWGLDLQNCTLYVPEGRILAYQNAAGWNSFTNIVEEGAQSDTTPLVATEWAALKQFFEKAGGADWTRSWTFGDSPETTKTLTGVTSRNGHVVRISLPSNNLSGQLGHELLTLSELSELDLSGNQLSGNLSTTLVPWLQEKNLKEVAPLTYLDISGNPFTGNLGLLGQALQHLTTLKAAECHFSELEPALPERISTVDIKHQNLEGETAFNQLLSVGNYDKVVPSIMRYNPESRTYDENMSFTLTDEQTEQRTWNVLMNISNDYAYLNNYYWWSYLPEYRRENGLLLYANSENGQEHIMRIRFNFLEGDVNFDAVRDIADLQGIITKALYNGYDLFNYTAANLVADDTINVQDVVAEINLLLSQDIPTQASARTKLKARGSRAEAPSAFVYIENGQLVLDCTEPVAAFDITLPTNGFEWLQPAPDIQHATKTHGDRLRVIGYSLSGGSIPAGRTVLAKVSASRIIGADLVDVQAKTIGTVSNTMPTGIAPASASIDVVPGNHQITLNVPSSTPGVRYSVYTLSGQLVAQGSFDAQATIAIPVAGQYMVKVTGPSLNIIKKVSVK